MRFRTENEIVPELALLREQLLGPPPEDYSAKRIEINDRLLELPYTLCLAHYTVSELVHYAEVAADAVVQREAPKPDAGRVGIYGLGPEHEGPMAHAVDAFFDAARRTQNAVLKYISLRYKVSVPKSLADAAKSIEKGKSPLENGVRDVIAEYWEQHGRRLKSYRDLGQHFCLLSSDARIVIAPDGRTALFFVLPNNPEVKDGSKLSFDDPRVFVVDYVCSELVALTQFIYDLTKMMVRRPAGVKRIATFSFRPPLDMTAISGTYVFDLETYDRGVEDFLRDMRGERPKE